MPYNEFIFCYFYCKVYKIVNPGNIFTSYAQTTQSSGICKQTALQIKIFKTCFIVISYTLIQQTTDTFGIQKMFIGTIYKYVCYSTSWLQI